MNENRRLTTACYVPLAIKYRPQKFSDVVGQDITIKIIINGLRKNRLGAAILFSGTRGVGKTTIARILAKAFRCENHANDEYEPCCKCESCLDFSRNSHIDVIEIDAASNTSVDDVREIIESSRYKPTTGEFKIFIIDEVHMLSKSAFNALLKTLEEPPAHVKFLLATTEVYKIPETIMSRVIRFNLNVVDEDLLAQHLSSICNQENVTATAEAITLIAKAASGSIRDGLSILDQAINMCVDDKLTSNDIKEMLNISNNDDIIDLLNFIFSSDIKPAIAKYREVTKNGDSCYKIIDSLMECVHTLTCVKIDVSLVEHEEYLVSKLKALSEKVSLSSLSKIWQMLIKGAEELKFCEHQKVVMEMILVRIVYASKLPDLQELINGTEKCVSKCVNASNGHESLVKDALAMFPNSMVKQ